VQVTVHTLLFFALVLSSAACGPGPLPGAPSTHTGSEPPGTSATAHPASANRRCDTTQESLSREADRRAAPHGAVEHVTNNFADGQVSWLMKERDFQTYVVEKKAPSFGRCRDGACYLFAAPSAVIAAAVAGSMQGGTHDPAALGRALGLPAKNLEGKLLWMTFDLSPGACWRLPVESDPGVWACKQPGDTDCFRFGGYTSGGVPELMVIDVPVAKAIVREVP
jgi:hypothetical protein